jgi:hypothetical protein
MKIKKGFDLDMNKTNAEILKSTLFAICKVSGRRTSESFAYKVINTILNSLKDRYMYLEKVSIQGTESLDQIQISTQINSIQTSELFKGLETIIRIVYMDLEDTAGLYFIKELKQQMEKDILTTLIKNGLDLNLLEMEQQHAFQYRQNKKNMAGDPSLLGYTWKDVSNWKYDDLNNVCILYDQQEHILDKLNLDAIIKEHIERLTGTEELEDIDDLHTERFKKEFELLHLLQQKDIDIDTAISLLKVDEDELDHMIKRLLDLGLLEYVDFDVVSLSEKGIKYIEEKP